MNTVYKPTNSENFSSDADTKGKQHLSFTISPLTAVQAMFIVLYIFF